MHTKCEDVCFINVIDVKLEADLQLSPCYPKSRTRKYSEIQILSEPANHHLDEY